MSGNKRSKKHELQPELREEIVRMAEIGIDVKMIAERLDVRLYPVIYHLEKEWLGDPRFAVLRKIWEETVLEYVKAGMRYEKIVEYMGANREAVLRVCFKEVPKPKHARKWLSKKQIAKVNELALQGMSIDQISRTLGISKRLCKYAGHGNFQSKGGRKKSVSASKVNKITQMLKDGYRQIYIANEVGVSKTFVQNIAAKLNMTRKSAKRSGNTVPGLNPVGASDFTRADGSLDFSAKRNYEDVRNDVVRRISREE